MHTLGGSWRRPALMLSCLLLAALTAGCTAYEAPPAQALEPKAGHGLVTIWMTPPASADAYDIVMLKAVPRFVSFHAADDETAHTLDDSPGYVTVAKGWQGRVDGWGVGEWPKDAEKDWLKTGIWFQDYVPVGDYGMIRIELLDATIFEGRSQPPLYIGSTNPSTGTPRLSFYAGSTDIFHVEEGDELVLKLETTIAPEGRQAFIIR